VAPPPTSPASDELWSPFSAGPRPAAMFQFVVGVFLATVGRRLRVYEASAVRLRRESLLRFGREDHLGADEFSGAPIKIH